MVYMRKCVYISDSAPASIRCTCIHFRLVVLNPSACVSAHRLYINTQVHIDSTYIYYQYTRTHVYLYTHTNVYTRIDVYELWRMKCIHVRIYTIYTSACIPRTCIHVRLFV